MPTLLEDRALETVDQTLVEEFDLERLARISEAPPAIELPRFTLWETAPAPRFRLRRTVVVAFLAAVIVSGLATIRPDRGTPYIAGSGSQATTTDAACAVGD